MYHTILLWIQFFVVVAILVSFEWYRQWGRKEIVLYLKRLFFHLIQARFIVNRKQLSKISGKRNISITRYLLMEKMLGIWVLMPTKILYNSFLVLKENNESLWTVILEICSLTKSNQTKDPKIGSYCWFGPKM